MALQSWDQLNKSNAGKTITPTTQQVGPVKSAISTVGNAINPTSPTNLPSQISNAAGNFFSNLQSHLGQYGQTVSSDMMNMTQNFGSDLGKINQGAETATSANGGNMNPLDPTAYQNAGQQMQGLGQIGSGVLQATGDVASGIFSPITEAINPIVKGTMDGLNKFIDFASGQPQGTTDANQATGNAGLQQKLMQAANNDPNTLKNYQAAANILMGLIGEKGADITGNLEDIPTKVSDTIGEAQIPKANVTDLSKNAVNSLENQPGEKPGALENAKNEIQRGDNPPVKVRTLEDGTKTIEDGRHHLEAAKQLGIKNYPIEDVTSKYQPESLATDKTTQSRINDATPTYEKGMIGTNVKTPEGKIAPRIASEGKGLTGERPVTISASEQAAGKELANIKDYPDKGTALEKSLSVQNAISQEAEGMRGKLQAEDKTNPLDVAKEKAKVTDLVKSNLPKDIKEKLGYISPAEEAKMTPTQKTYRNALISQQEEVLPKTAAGRYYQKVLDAVKEYDGTREGKLNLRQTIDNAYKNARGKLAFGSDSQNAIDEVNTDIRDSLNKDLKATTQNTDTQASLDKQTNLYRAKDVLDTKAQAEASSKAGRYGQRHPMQKSLGRRLGMREVASIGATAAGLTYATSQINKAIKNAASGN